MSLARDEHVEYLILQGMGDVVFELNIIYSIQYRVLESFLIAMGIC